MKDLPREIERKYLIIRPTDDELRSLPQANRSEIVQVYLTYTTENTSRRVRKRGTSKSGYRYYYTEKTPVSFGEKIEIEREISENEYDTLLKEADPERKPIVKERYCFSYKNQFFELDIYEFSKELATLEIELDDIDAPVELPDFIGIIKDVTNDNRYSNASLARTQKLNII